MDGIDELKRRRKAITDHEDTKDKLIESMFLKVDELRKVIDEKEREVQRAERLVNSYEVEVRELKEIRDESECKKNELAYVSVLIDGDCMKFEDSLVKSGREGGRRAVKLLKESVKQHMRTLKIRENLDFDVRIHVYAHVAGLAQKYCDIGILSGVHDVQEFIRGFNMEYEYCDFVDVGKRKEGADTKLKAMVNKELRDVHCLQVVFGGSADNGYASVLSPYQYTKRIVLVIGPPLARDLAEIADGFETIKFPEVFRAKDLDRKVSFSTPCITPPKTPPVTNYATVTKTGQPDGPSKSGSSGSTSGSSSDSTAGSASSQKNRSRLGPVSKNAKHQRVDRFIKTDPEAVKYWKSKKMCNMFYLLNDCTYQRRAEGCEFDHSLKLEDYSLKHLEYIARLSPCQTGVYCNDPRCLKGHQCPKMNSCDNVNCNFPREMHNIDSVVVKN